LHKLSGVVQSLSLAPPPFFAFANSSAIAKESLERASRSRSRLSRVYTRRFLSPYSFFFFFFFPGLIWAFLRWWKLDGLYGGIGWCIRCNWST
jgi:hypothetical protein